MKNLIERCTVDGDLTPELLARKSELDQSLETELDKIEQNKSLTWVIKQKQTAELQQAYEDLWEKELDAAGYIVRPTFESLSSNTFGDWYDTLSNINS